MVLLHSFTAFSSISPGVGVDVFFFFFHCFCKVKREHEAEEGGPANFGCPLRCLSEYVSPKVSLIKALELTAREEKQHQNNNMAASPHTTRPCMHKKNQHSFI